MPALCCRSRRNWHACVRQTKSRAKPSMQQCYIHTSFGGFPLRRSLPSLSPPLVSSDVHVFTITFSPTHCCIRLHSPHIKPAAYLYLYCVYQSGSDYSCEAAAINSLEQESGGRISQLMIKTMTASILFMFDMSEKTNSCRAERLAVSWQITTSKLINELYELLYWLWFWLTKLVLEISNNERELQPMII